MIDRGRTWTHTIILRKAKKSLATRHLSFNKRENEGRVWFFDSAVAKVALHEWICKLLKKKKRFEIVGDDFLLDVPCCDGRSRSSIIDTLLSYGFTINGGSMICSCVCFSTIHSYGRHLRFPIYLSTNYMYC